MANNTEKLLQLIRNNIRKYREAKKLTQVKLSLLAEVSEDYISELERGKSMPSIKLLARIADALEIEIYKFFVDEVN